MELGSIFMKLMILLILSTIYIIRNLLVLNSLNWEYSQAAVVELQMPQ